MAENNLVGLRSPLARVRGLGSAHAGTEHFWFMRWTSIVLVPLSVWFVISLLVTVVGGSFAEVHAWIANPWVATMLVLFLGLGFWHAAAGFQTILEDYIHTELTRVAAILAVKAACGFAALLSVVSVLKIAFGG